MKLNKIIVKNFRAINGDNNEIRFDKSNIIFLVGQNNVGKSSFLRAYEFFVESKQKASLTDFHNNNINNPIVIEGWFIRESSDCEDKELGKEPDWLKKWVNENGIIKIRKTWSKEGEGFDKFTYNPSTQSWDKNGFGGFHTKLQKYSPTPIFIKAIETTESIEKKVNDLINDKFLKQIETTHQEEFNAIRRSIMQLQRKITSSNEVSGYNQNINSDFKTVFPDITIQISAKGDDNIDIIKSFEKNHSLAMIKDGTEREDIFTQHGHGVIRVALFNFLKFLSHEKGEMSYLILFEEPEIFLHPMAAFSLRETLYQLTTNSQFQILCATHSPLMIDISKPHCSIVRVVKNDQSTETIQADENIFQADDERKNLIQMINKFNPHVCEIFYTDKVLLVEGDTEAIVYRELLSKLFPDDKIFVLNTGSKNCIPFFQEILTHFMIEHYVIHDTDKRKRKDGAKNSAWKLNEVIWNNKIAADNRRPGLARRYVHIPNFEQAHNYEFDEEKGKPLSAYEFSQTITNKEQDIFCLNWLRDIINNKEIVHDQEYIEREVPNDSES